MSLASKLTQERRSRLAAERLLELKQAELFAANAKLGRHAQQLSEQIVETRAQVETIRGENRRVKSDLSAANQRIALTERRLWHTIETVNDGFAFFDQDGKMIMANRAYLAVFDGLEMIKPGVNYVTILQALTDEGIVNTGDMRPRDWRQMMSERFLQPHPPPTMIRLWNGRYIRLLDQRGPDGDIVSLGLDITEEVAYKKRLKQARRVAESANRAKSAFLANISHEIRTPMNGVIGMADLLLETHLDAEQKTYLQTIKHSAEALLVIINDVLDFSKIEAEKLEIKATPFDLREAVDEVLMLLRPSAEAKGIELILAYDESLPSPLIGDPGRLRQVLTNLVGNAVKFTPKGHVRVSLTCKGDPGASQITLGTMIEDTGIGIPADFVEHIFGDFNQVDSDRNRQFEGTGLGLAISDRLVRMMGGEIGVTSEEGVGSCFFFEVGLEVPDEARRRQAQNRGDDIADGAAPPPPRKLRLLAAEDNKTNQLVFAKMIKALNVDLTFANNGEEAIALFEEIGPDLIFMDISMPKVDGKQATAAIRALEGPERTPIIALTAHAMSGDEEDILAAGLDGYMTKPLNKSRIIAQIEAHHRPGMAPLQPDQEAG